MTSKQEKYALFWSTHLGVLLLEERDEIEEERILLELSRKEVVLPSGKRRVIRLRTWRKMLRKYRDKGYEAFFRQARSDLGKPRKQRDEIIAKAIELKKEQPTRSDVIINKVLMKLFGQTVPRSTLYRHFKKEGATRIKLGLDKKPARKSWTCKHTHDMWLCDFADGPYVMENGVMVPTHLVVFIDKHSRYVVSAKYALSEDLSVLRIALIEGVAVHGLALAYYFDNAKVFRALAWSQVCIRMGQRVYYRPVREPEPGGMIERFIQTTQGQFETEVRAQESPYLNLATLNEAYRAWLQTVYHKTVHSEINQTPEEMYKKGRLPLRNADMASLNECFFKRVIRKVDPSYSDVRIDCRFYKVDLKLRGDKIEVRYDPEKPYDAVELYTPNGQYLGQGLFHKREEKRYPQPVPNTSKKPITNVIELLIDESKKEHKEELEAFFQGSTGEPRTWSFSAFAATWAELTGRQGGISAFSEQELVFLQEIHERHPNLTRALLKKAVAMVKPPTTFIKIANQIQKQEENK